MSGTQGDRGFPVSVKGVVTIGGRFLLLRNERDEWELPGGRLEPDETPEECCAREIMEETSLRVTVAALVDAWVYHPTADAAVLILAYGCELVGGEAVRISDEHLDARLFAFDEIPRKATPAGYVGSIDKWRGRVGARPVRIAPTERAAPTRCRAARCRLRPD